MFGAQLVDHLEMWQQYEVHCAPHLNWHVSLLMPGDIIVVHNKMGAWRHCCIHASACMPGTETPRAAGTRIWNQVETSAPLLCAFALHCIANTCPPKYLDSPVIFQNEEQFRSSSF